MEQNEYLRTPDEMRSMEAEQSVLGGLLYDNDSLYRIDQLDVDDFFYSEHREIFQTIKQLVDKNLPFDVVTIAEENTETDLGYMTSLVKTTPTADNVPIYAKIVTDYAQKRALYVALQNAISKLWDEPLQDVVSYAQVEIDNVTRHELGESVYLASEVNTELDRIRERAQKEQLRGIPTGINAIDNATGGLNGPRLWCVAARPSIGKTALTLQWAIHSGRNGYCVGICSLEMGKDELITRGLAHLLQVNGSALSFGDKETLRIAEQKLGHYNAPLLQNIYLDTQCFSLSSIVARITEWKHKHNIAWAIVDHIGLVEAEANNRNEQIGKITRALKKLTKKLNMPIVAVSQLNRASEKENRKPQLSDLRDSGNIEQDIDIGIFIHAYESDVFGTEVQLGALKNRLGRSGWLKDKFVFDGVTQTFKQVENF